MEKKLNVLITNNVLIKCLRYVKDILKMSCVPILDFMLVDIYVMLIEKPFLSISPSSNNS